MMLNKKFNRWSNFKIMALLPLAAFLFVVIALFNALIPREMSASPVKPLDVFGFNHNSDQLNSLGTPADTIKTKTIKIVQKHGRPDSTVTETYDVKVIGDTARGTKIIYYNDRKMTGDTSTVTYVIGKDHPEIMITEEPDSLDVLVKTDVRLNNKIVITKNIQVNNSDNQELSNVLFMIDGIEHREKDAMMIIDPADIESMQVIKDKKIMKKYTDKDYEGIIIITSKAKKK